MRVALVYRVLQHWRVPVFRRLSQQLDGEFCAFHGSDFVGTKAVNSKDLNGFEHRQMRTAHIKLRRGNVLACLPFCPALLFHLMKYRPDVILTEGGGNVFNNISVWLYSKLTGTPYVWWTLGELDTSTRQSLPIRLWRWLIRVQEEAAAVYLGYSSRALQYFESRGYPEDRQFRAVNCVDTDGVLARIPKFEQKAEELRARLGLIDHQIILFVGAIYYTKRLDVLIDAQVKIQQKHPKSKLIIVGEGPHRATLEQQARERGVDVLFTGQVIDDVSSYFLMADIFVLPGLGGLSISEAMAHNLPILATVADGCEVDLVQNDFNGAILELGSVEALTAKLDEILSTPGKAREMGENSGWIIRERYNIHTYMDNVMKALRRADELGKGIDRKPESVTA